MGRACRKLIVYKDRLSQFEVPVFQQYVVLIVPTILELMRYDGEEHNVSGSNLGALHEDKVHDDVNSVGGTVTSVASGYSTKSSTSIKSIFGSAERRKSSSRNSSVDHEDANDTQIKNKKRKKKKTKKNKKKSKKSDDEKDDEINITISAKTKMKKTKDGKWRKHSMSASPNPPSKSLSSLSKTAVIKEKKIKKERNAKKEESSSKA